MRDLGTPVYGRSCSRRSSASFPTDARLHIGRLNGAPVAVALSYALPRLDRGAVGVVAARASRALSQSPALLAHHHRRRSPAAAASSTSADRRRNDGTYHFKEQWGAAPHPLWWEYVLGDGQALPADDRHSAKYQMTIDLWKRLPLGLATAVGPHIAGWCRSVATAGGVTTTC